MSLAQLSLRTKQEKPKSYRSSLTDFDTENHKMASSSFCVDTILMDFHIHGPLFSAVSTKLVRIEVLRFQLLLLLTKINLRIAEALTFELKPYTKA